MNAGVLGSGTPSTRPQNCTACKNAGAPPAMGLRSNLAMLRFGRFSFRENVFRHDRFVVLFTLPVNQNDMEAQ